MAADEGRTRPAVGRGEPRPLVNSRTGAQTADRALTLLRMVAGAPGDGLRLSDLAAASGLDRATAFRLLSSLVAHGLVEQDAATKRYQLGLEFFALAAAASNRYDVAEVARAALARLAEETGDTAVFCLRSGLNLVCIDVQTGSFPIRTLPMDIGSHRPLGAGASGIAFLAALPAFEADRVLADNAARLSAVPGQNASDVAAAVRACRETGYAVAAEEQLGRVLGIAVALINRRGRPQGTLTIAGIAERIAPGRLDVLTSPLLREARLIEETMWRMPDQHRHRTSWSRV